MEKEDSNRKRIGTRKLKRREGRAKETKENEKVVKERT